MAPQKRKSPAATGLNRNGSDRLYSNTNADQLAFTPLERLLTLLPMKPVGAGKWRADCPCCKGTQLTIEETDTGRVLLDCFDGCPVVSILTRLGLVLADLVPKGIEAGPGEQAPRPHEPMGLAKPDPYAKEWERFAAEASSAEEDGNEAEPIPLLPDLEQPTPYPIGAFPSVMREAVEAIAYHAQVPMAMAGQCVIGAAAYVAQSRANAHHTGRTDGMPCSLFQLTLGNSGDRKSECHRLAFRPIHKAEKDARRRHKAEADQLKSTADATKGKERAELQSQLEALQNPQTLFSDATYEPIAAQFIRGMPAASWDTDEGGQMLAGASLKADTRAQTLGGLVKLYDTGEVQRTRSASNPEASGFAYNRRLCLHLLAQPVAVCGALTDPLLQGQGFLPRFLFAAPESLAGTRTLTLERMQKSPLDDQRLLTFWERISTLLDSKTYATVEGEIKAPVMLLSASATTIWLDFYNETEREQGGFGEYAELRPFAGRAGELAKRLATVLAFFAGETEISEETMRGACALVRHSLAEWLRFLHHVAPNEDLVSAQKLLDWLKLKGWDEFHRDKLGKSGPGFVRNSAKKRDRLLGILCEHHHLQTIDGKTFKINPRPVADSEDSAEKSKIDGFSIAENLRKSEENLRSESVPANNPQLSAKSPQGETRAKSGFPQNPQNPHAKGDQQGDGASFGGEI